MRAPASRVVLRPLVDADVPDVLELAHRLRRWFSSADLREIATLLQGTRSGLVAATPAGRIVGFLLDAPTAEPHARELAWMAVDAEWQGQGIGSLLLERFLADQRSLGTHAIEVSTVAESAGYAPYDATRAFYHHRGFADLRIDKDYYWPGGDRLVLRRPLQ